MSSQTASRQASEMPSEYPPSPNARAVAEYHANGGEVAERQIPILSLDISNTQNLGLVEDDTMSRLHDAFDSMAVDGRITLDQLDFLLGVVDLQATIKEIEEAIAEQIPDANGHDVTLDFFQVQALYHHFLNALDGGAQDLLSGAAARRPGVWAQFRQWVHLKWQERRMAQKTAYEKHMKPTTRLLLMILCTSCLISLAVVLFAILFIWGHSEKAMVRHLERDAEIMRDGLHQFAFEHPHDEAHDKIQELASLLGLGIEELGYGGMEETTEMNLMRQNQLLGSLMDQWFDDDALISVNMSVSMLKTWAEQMLLAINTTQLSELVTAMNAQLPDGHEVGLVQRDPKSGQFMFLTKLRSSGDCGGSCSGNGISNFAPWEALSEDLGAIFTQDHQQQQVASGFAFLSSSNVGLFYNVQRSILLQDFITPVANTINDINTALNNNDTISDGLSTLQTEMVLVQQVNSSPVQVLSKLRNCDGSCLRKLNSKPSFVTQAVNGNASFQKATDLQGKDVYIGYSSLNNTGLGLITKVARQGLVDELVNGIDDALDTLSTMLPGTQEVHMATYEVLPNGTRTGNVHFQMASKCTGHCQEQRGRTTLMLQRALEGCSNGNSLVTDDSDPVWVATYSCIPSLQAALAVKLDRTDILARGVGICTAVANGQNFGRYANTSFEVVMAQKKQGVANVSSAADYVFTALPKDATLAKCANMTCPRADSHMIAALNHETGFQRAPDYQGIQVFGAYTYLESLGLGLVVKVDVAEAEQPRFTLTGLLVACSVASVVLSMVSLAFLANVLLKSMDQAWEEGKKAIEQERQAFRDVIEAFYPAQVAKRMLAGETEIVYTISGAAVFFSDIFEFTTTSNCVTPRELIQFMGYTFGVMDIIAERFHVYKVKTIGDAYMAVSGLPGVESVHGNTTLDLLLFASCCAQVFSNRFLHPEEGAILDKIVASVLKKKDLVKVTTQPDAPYSDRMGRSQSDYASANDFALPAHCIMRYGLAAGHITAGVLQGKAPLFDIWGKTVNLASRMESTGQAGQIQVSESIHSMVMALKGQPFSFQGPHKVFCKGFGNVSAYFVKTCCVAPPDELIAALHLKHSFGNFRFQQKTPNKTN